MAKTEKREETMKPHQDKGGLEEVNKNLELVVGLLSDIAGSLEKLTPENIAKAVADEMAVYRPPVVKGTDGKMYPGYYRYDKK